MELASAERSSAGSVVTRVCGLVPGLRRDAAIIEWEQGDAGADLVQVSEADAQELIERFREKWGREG